MPPAAIARSVAERDLALAARQQELDRRRRRELRRATEAAVARGRRSPRASSSASISAAARSGPPTARSAPTRRPPRRTARPAGRPAGACSCHASDDRVQHHPPARQAVPGLGREVGAGVERRLVGSQERVQRPAALAGHRLARVHADCVDVGTLLAVDLDAHEPSFITAAISGSSKDSCAITWHQWHAEYPIETSSGRSSSRARVQRLLAPRIPVDRVVLVLEQVGRGLACKAVRHSPRLPLRIRRTTLHPLPSGGRAIVCAPRVS